MLKLVFLSIHKKCGVLRRAIADWLAWSHQMRKQQQENPPQFIEKLRQLKAKKQVNSQQDTSSQAMS
jgi:hypothetical protein